MKSGLKWRFAAQAALAVIVVFQAGLLCLYSVSHVPRVIDYFDRLGLPPPVYMRPFASLSRVVPRALQWLPLIILAILALGWGIFELRCKSEAKPLIRLAAGALICLVMALGLFLVTVSSW